MAKPSNGTSTRPLSRATTGLNAARPLPDTARSSAFCLVIAGAALMPAPTRAASDVD
jgi:hypothetical protein